MILLVHNNNNVVRVTNLNSFEDIIPPFKSPAKSLFSLSEKFPDSVLVWCHKDQQENINLEYLSKNFHLKNMMMSYSSFSFLPMSIGYVEDSPFVNINTSVVYPTWLMSSQVGAIYGAQLLKFKPTIKQLTQFDYVLNSIAKLGMPHGLFCYSNPRLLNNPSLSNTANKASKITLFKFVKQHFKARWVFLLLLNFIIYDKKFLFLALIKSLFIKKISVNKTIKTEPLQNLKRNNYSSMDVIIPTIGRKEFLFDVLKDLSNQTMLPKKVIIIEQSNSENQSSELEYLGNNWPFRIIHELTPVLGACNARNMALTHLSSDLVFFADDDIRFDENTLEKACQIINDNSFDAITMNCLQKGEIDTNKTIKQWSSFGSGCSVVSTKAVSGLTFDLGFEHGFGEDTDFGMQLRNKSVDIFYFSDIKLLHLKAPIGGFRTKYVQPWESQKISSKPSPTVMLHRIKNNSKHQLLGYKTVLFFKYYRNQPIKNPFTYLKQFKNQWEQSVIWANKLNNSASS